MTFTPIKANMSFVNTYNAFQIDNLTAGQKAVLTAIATFERNGKAWPSVATIAKRASMGVRTVQRHLAALINLGYITRTYRAGKAAVTRLFIGQTPAKLAGEGMPNWHPESDIQSVNQVPAVHEPATPEHQHQQATAPVAVSPQSLFSDIEQPEKPTPTIPDLEQPVTTTTEAPKTPVEPSNEPEGTTTPTDTATPAVEHQAEVPATQDQATEADPLASVPETLMKDLGEVRKAKKRPAKPTKTEAALWWQEAQKAGWDMQTVITTMILHGWARFQADWVQHVPPQTAPAAPKVWTPEKHTPASASTLAQMKEKIRQMKERWAASELAQTAQPPMRQ